MKTKVSQFEFAIMETITPKKAKKFEPRTDEEELNLRQQKLLSQAENLDIPVVSISLPSRKDYDHRNLKPMLFKEDTTVDGKVLFVKGDEWQPYNWNYNRTIEYLKDGRLGYEC